MIITIILSVYCVPRIVLRALPMLLYLTHLRVKYKLHGQTGKNSIVSVLSWGGVDICIVHC